MTGPAQRRHGARSRRVPAPGPPLPPSLRGRAPGRERGPPEPGARPRAAGGRGGSRALSPRARAERRRTNGGTPRPRPRRTRGPRSPSARRKASRSLPFPLLGLDQLGELVEVFIREPLVFEQSRDRRGGGAVEQRPRQLGQGRDCGLFGEWSGDGPVEKTVIASKGTGGSGEDRAAVSGTGV